MPAQVVWGPSPSIARTEGGNHSPMAGTRTLGEIAARIEMLTVSCNRCDRRGQLRVDRLLAEHGAALPGPRLRRIVAADCPRMIAGEIHDMCGVHFPDMSKVF